MPQVELDGSWSIAGKPHGGYLLRVLAEAAADGDHPDPLAVSAHYVASPQPGAAEVEVERLRVGRRVTSSRVRLSQGGATRVEALLSAGRVGGGDVPFWRSGLRAPDLPPPEDCPRSPSRGPAFEVGMLDHVDLRLSEDSRRWMQGQPAGRARYEGWLRRADGADATPLDLLVFADAFPPVTFDLGVPGWVPTLELTVHVRARPAPGWLRGRQTAHLLQDGWLDEDVELWDSEGRLVAQARQLAGYLPPG